MTSPFRWTPEYDRILSDVIAGRDDRSAVSNFARGLASGVARTGTSLAEVVGMVPGLDVVGAIGRELEEAQQEYFDPQGRAGTAGQFIGRAAGEIGSAVAGGGAVAKGLSAVARGGGRGAAAARRVAEGLSSQDALTRALSTAAVSAPVDVVQGLKEEEGMLLPGRLGSVAENVAFSGAAGAIPWQRIFGRAGVQQGPALPPDFDAGPQYGPVRGLLTASSTETAPRIIPASGDFPAMTSTEREIIRRPVTSRAAAPATQPAIPTPARMPEDVLPPQQGQARAALMEPRAEGPAIPQRSGLIPESRRLPAVSSADDLARRAMEAEAVAEAAVERAAIEAAERPGAWDLDLDDLKARLKPLPKSKKGIAALSDDDLLDHAVYRTRVAEEGVAAEATLDEMKWVLERAAGGKRMGLRRAKKMFGGDIAEISDLAKFTEDQISALRERGWDASDVLRTQARVTAAERGALTLARVDAEMSRRGLSIGRDFDALQFDPSAFDRSGFVRTQVLSTLAGGGTGAALGAAGAAPEDRGAGAVLGGLLGAGAGLGLGRALERGFAGAARGAVEGATPPVTPPIGEQAVQQRARAEEAITFPAKPTPRTAEYQPISEQAMRERLQRTVGDEEVVERLLEQRRAGEALQRQGRRSVADELAVADKRMRDLAEPELMEPTRTLTGAEVARLRQRADGLTDVQKKLKRALLDESIDSERKVLMQQYIDDLDRQINNTVVRATRDASQTARDLAVLRYAKKTSSNPFDWMRRVMAETGGDLPPEPWAKIQQALQANDFAKAQIEMSKLRKNTLWDKTGELWQTGLLTNVGRPIRDVVSNTLNLTDKQLERATATVFDRLVGAVARTGTRTAAYDASSLQAAKQGFRKGYQAAKSIMRGSTAGLTDPKFLERVMKRYDFERETMQSHPWLRAYTTFVRRTIGASDALVYEAALQASLAEQARVFAMRTAKPGTEAYKALVTKYLTDASGEAMGEAMSHAMEVTWQNRTALGEAGMALRTAQNPAVRLLGKLAVPFVQTPSAMITQAVKGTPFGLLSPENLGAIRDLARKTNMPDAQRKLVNQLAKTSIGSAWIAAGYMLAADDKMTTFYPNDDRERRRWELEGRTEAALKVGGTWVSLLGMLGPQAQLMTLGAALRRMTEDDPEWTAGLAAKTMATGVGRAALDSPMLQGIKTISDVAQKAGSADTDALGESLNQAAQTFVTGWVPQVVQQAARATDVTPEGLVRVRQVREPGDPAQTAVNALMQGVPGLRQQVPVRQSALGGERALSVGGFGVLSPARLTRETTDPRAQELWRTGAAIARTPRRKGESQEVYEARQAALGAAASRAVDAVMASEGYRQVSALPTQSLRAALANLSARGDVQAEQVAKLERLPDEELRARLQGIILERAISRARTAAGRAYPDPAGGRGGSLLNALTR